jgi:uncharacterized protein (DUF111 family)
MDPSIAGRVALAALLLAMGCPPDRLDEALEHLGSQDVAFSLQGIHDQVSAVLVEMGV